MRKSFSGEFVFQLAALLVAVIVVHALYVLVVRPKADVILAEQAAMMQADPAYVQERSVWVIVRDFEQEACFILMLWAFAIMGSKSTLAVRAYRMVDEELVSVAEGTKILPEDAREYARQIQSLPSGKRSSLLPQARSSLLPQAPRPGRRPPTTPQGTL